MTEITIRGAGIFGLSIAWACTRRGARVRVIDPNGVAAGASGGIVGALAPHVPENWNSKKAFQLDSLLMAESFWNEIAEISGMNPGYARTGRLQPIADDAALTLARQRAQTALPLWGDHAVWQIEDAPTAWSPVSPTGLVIRDTLSAHLHPHQACTALAAALTQQGVSITAEGPDQGAVIWAIGTAGLETLSQNRPRPVGMGVKGQAALLRYDAGGSPQIFADTLHIIPHLDGSVAIGSTTENSFDHNQPDDLLDALIARARAVVPALHDAEVTLRWAGLRPRARSRAPMLGEWPDRPGHFIANGGFKIGFGMAPKIAEVMATLVLDGKNTIPEEFSIAQSF